MERTVAGVHPDTNGEGRRDSTGERGETCTRKERVYQREGGSTHSHPILQDTRRDSNVAVRF